MSSTIHTRKARMDLINRMKKDTIFTEQFECENMAKKYDELCVAGSWLGRSPFRDFMVQTFDITEDLLLDRLFKAFDMDNDNKISPEEWFQGMSTFLGGSTTNRAKFCFNVYDINNDGFLSREEMFLLLKKCLQNSKVASDEDPEEGIKDLVELVFKKLKKNETASDHMISLQEFEEVVTDDSLMMECLGACLPPELLVQEFQDKVCYAGNLEYRKIKERELSQMCHK